MDISIIIVNYKKYDLTEMCIESIMKTLHNLSYEIIIIDNNSPNESYNILVNKYSQFDFITIHRNNKNTGFGAANNIAAKVAKSSVLLFLNPDVIVLENSIKSMYDKLKSNLEVGLVGCKLLNQDLTLQYSCRRFLKFHEFIISRTPLKVFFHKSYIEKINAKYLMKDFNHTEDIFVDWIMGSCMIMRKELFEKLGGFSKDYFMYFEDVDLCYKVNNHNKKVLYTSYAQMIHMHNQESVKSINKLTFIHLKSMLIFYKKYYISKLGLG
jgi:GT2 family glycosyltransferase